MLGLFGKRLESRCAALTQVFWLYKKMNKRTYTHRYIYIHIYVYIYMYIYTYIYIHKYNHICVDTHTYIHLILAAWLGDGMLWNFCVLQLGRAGFGWSQPQGCWAWG